MAPLRWLLNSPIALMVTGAVLGLAVVGILWWSGVIFSTGDQAPTATTQGAPHPDDSLTSRQELITELELLAAARPDDPSVLFELGETYMVGNDWVNAIWWFTRLLEVEPGNTHARLDIGTANMNLGLYQQAEAAFSQVLEMEPESVQAHYNMGYLFAFRQDSPDVDEAAGHWREVLRLAPDSNLAQVARQDMDRLGIPETP